MDNQVCETTEMDFWRRSARTSKTVKKANIEIRARMGIERNITIKIDKKRMQWYGHVQRMDVLILRYNGLS